MELELRLALPGSNPSTSHLDAGDHDQRTTLPLFVDDNGGGGGGGGVVGGGGELGDGWVKSNVDDDGGGCGGRRRSGRCVKVKMDGVGIGRKVDVSLHHSYQALFHTLKRMFPIDHHDGEINHDEYVITYENERGDWMVVGDVPWEAFIKSVKQLKILT